MPLGARPHAGVKIEARGPTLSVYKAVWQSASVRMHIQHRHRSDRGVGLGRRWEPGKRTLAVITQESRCSQDVMCAVQVTVQNTVE